MSNKNDQKNISGNNLPEDKKSSSKTQSPVKTHLLGVGVTNETEKNILEYIVKIIENSSKNLYVVTPNPEMIILSDKNSEFRSALNQADLALCDGIGLFIAGKFLRKPYRQRISGADFVERLCERVSKRPITVGFLGGGPGVAERTAECLKDKYPGLKVAFTGEEWDKTANSKWQIANSAKEETKSIKNDMPFAISYKPIDILFVAFGFPKQELWMRDHLNKIPVRIMMGVGGSFDYISGNVSRAPKIVRDIGFEWIYRLIRQPWRWKRQLSLIAFMGMVVKERFKIKN